VDTTAKRGIFELVTGPMFAGKTQLLLARLSAAEALGQRILAVKPNVDSRWPNEIVSHSGNRRRALIVRDGSELLEHVDGHAIVGVDEGQFFGRELVYAIAKLRLTTHVVVAALDLDFRAEPFAVVRELVARADVIHRLHAICGSCGASATLTQRFVDGAPARYDDPVVRVGGSELYAPRCRRCYGVEREAVTLRTA
jgi:thymidine kinase